MQSAELQLAGSLHELCWALESSRQSGDYAQASHHYWVIRHYSNPEHVDMALLPLQTALAVTLEQIADKWLDDEIKKAFRQQDIKVHRGMKLYKEQYTQRWEEAIAAATPIHKQQRQKAIAATKALGEKVEAEAAKALHWATEIERMVSELQQNGQPDPFEDRRLALAQTIRTKTEHYRHAYLSQIEALLRANESVNAIAAIQPAVSVGGVGSAANADRSTSGSLCHDGTDHKLSGSPAGSIAVATLPRARPVNPVSALHGQESADDRVTPPLPEQADSGDHVHRAEGCAGVTRLELEILRLQAIAEAAAADRLGDEVEYTVRTSKQGQALLENMKREEQAKRQGQITTLQRKVDRLKGIAKPSAETKDSHQERLSLHQEVGRLKRLISETARRRFKQSGQSRQTEEGKQLYKTLHAEAYAKRKPEIDALHQQIAVLEGKPVPNQLPYLLIIPNAPERFKSVSKMDAIDRYNAPVHQMLRQFATEHDVDWKALDCPVDLWILSTKYSLIPARMCIRSYEREMPSDADQEAFRPLRARLRAMLNAIAKQRTYAEVYLYLPETYRAALGDMARFFPHTPITLGSGDHSEESLDQLEVWLEKAIAANTETLPVATPALTAYEGELMPRNAVTFSLVGSQTTFNGVITAIADQRVTISSHAFPHPVTVERSRIHSKHEWQVGDQTWLRGHIDFDKDKDPFVPWVKGTVTKVQEGDCVISCPNYRQGHCSWVWVEYEQKLQDCSGRAVDPKHRDRWVAGLKAKGGILSSDAHTKACNLFLYEPTLPQLASTTESGSSQGHDHYSDGKSNHSLAKRQPALHNRLSGDRLRSDLPLSNSTVTEPLLPTTEVLAMDTQTPELFAPRASSYDRDRWILALTNTPVKDKAFKECLSTADQYAISVVLDDLVDKPGTKSRTVALTKQLKQLQETAETVEVEHQTFTGRIQSDPERGLRLQVLGHRGMQQWFRYFIDSESISEVIAWFKSQVDQDIAAVEDKKRVFVGSRNVQETILLHQEENPQKELWDALEEGDHVTLNNLPKPEDIHFLETKPVGEIGEWVRVNMGDQPLYHNKMAQVTAIHDEGKTLEVRSDDGTFSGAVFDVCYLWKPARTVRYSELSAASVFQVFKKTPGLYLTYEGSEPFRANSSWIAQILPHQNQSETEQPEASVAFTDAELESLYDRPILEQITALLQKYDFIDNTDFLQDDPHHPDVEYRGWQIEVDPIGLTLIKDDRLWDRPLLTEDDPLADADEETVTAYAKQIIDAVEAALETLSGQQSLLGQSTLGDASETVSPTIAEPSAFSLQPSTPTPYSRRLIIGDVHGHYDALMQLLELAKFTAEDQLYFLGDLIDRGPKSKEVLEFVRSGKHHCVLGNHEQLLLNALAEHADKSGRARLAHWTQNGGKETIYSYVDSYKVTEFVEQMHESGTVDWLKALPLSIDLDDLFLVHAGLRPDVPLEQQEARDLLWIRNDFFYHPTPYFPDKLIVGGHTYTIHLDVEAGKLVKGPGWLNIETGAAFSHSGWLTALDWTDQIVYQVNAEIGASRQLPFDEATVTLLPTYQEEDSTFFHNGNTYDLNPLFTATARRRVQSFDVADLDWILEEEPSSEQERVDRADLTCPILVTRCGDKLLTVDGCHRLTKAKQRDIDQLPARLVTAEEMEAALIQAAPEPLPSTQQVETSDIAVGDRVICREHPYAMDDWTVQNLNKKQATCYSAILNEKRKIPLAELELYTPEKEFPRWKSGDRVQLRYPRRHVAPQQVFEVRYQHFNGMVPVTGTDGIEYSFFCFDLELAKVLASSEVLEAASQTYSADRLTGAKPTLKGLIEHEAQLWVAVASGGDAPVLGYSWVELVRVIPAEEWQETMQTSDLYSGKQATYQKRQWRLTGDRLRFHLDSDTVEASPPAETPIHRSTIAVPGGEIAVQVFQAPDEALQLEFRSALIAVEDYPNGEIIAHLHPWDLEDMEDFPDGEEGIQVYVKFAAEEYHRQFRLNLWTEMERVKPVVRKWLKSIDKTRRVAVLTDIQTHGSRVADTRTLLEQYPSRTGGDYSDAVKELVMQSIAQEELVSLNAATLEEPFTFDLEPIIANVETEAWWETKAGMAAQCLEANDASGAFEQLNGLKKDDLQRAAERLGLHCSGTKKVMLAEIERSLPHLTQAAKALANYTSDLLHLGHEYRELSEHLKQAQENDAAPTAFLTYRAGAEIQISDYLRQLETQFNARVQQEGQEIPQAVQDSYPELVATLVSESTSDLSPLRPPLILEDASTIGFHTVRVTDLITSQKLEERAYKFGQPQFCWVGYGPIEAEHKHDDWKPGDIEEALAEGTSFFHPPDFVYSLRDESSNPPWFFINLSAWAYTEAELAVFNVNTDDIDVVMVEVPPSNWAVNEKDKPQAIAVDSKGFKRGAFTIGDHVQIRQADASVPANLRGKKLVVIAFPPNDESMAAVKRVDWRNSTSSLPIKLLEPWTEQASVPVADQVEVTVDLVSNLDTTLATTGEIQTLCFLPFEQNPVPEAPFPGIELSIGDRIILRDWFNGDRRGVAKAFAQNGDVWIKLDSDEKPERFSAGSLEPEAGWHGLKREYQFRLIRGDASRESIYTIHALYWSLNQVGAFTKGTGRELMFPADALELVPEVVEELAFQFEKDFYSRTLKIDDRTYQVKQGNYTKAANLVITSGTTTVTHEGHWTQDDRDWIRQHLAQADFTIEFTDGAIVVKAPSLIPCLELALKVHRALASIPLAQGDPTVKIWRLFDDKWIYTGTMERRSTVELKTGEIACLPAEDPNDRETLTVKHHITDFAKSRIPLCGDRRTHPASDINLYFGSDALVSCADCRRLWQERQDEALRQGYTVNVKYHEYDRYIGRANARLGLPISKWHNPYKVNRDGTLDEVLEKFRVYLLGNAELMTALPELQGKRKACYCCGKDEKLLPDDPLKCHGQILDRALRGDYKDQESGVRSQESE